MSAVQVSYAPSRQLYDEVGKHLDLENDRPDGLIAHTACELPDGRVQIVDLWESIDAIERFGVERIFPAFAAAGVPDEVVRATKPTPYETFVHVG